ncbi:MAG: hypothetical protein DRQ46_00110 [Gammaproteobacteria bacterium]|nr:MAG: hypothetical protein DRQ46_00110 [Gammaproteobacteria bacterium]
MKNKKATGTKEYPILFNAEMVKAILDGRKTVTRRPIKPQPMQNYGPSGEPNGLRFKDIMDSLPCDLIEYCPYGQVGDLLWVRENCYIAPPLFGDKVDENCVDYKGQGRVVGYSASMDSESVRCANDYGVKQTPSIHMFRWASRITLRIKSVKVEQIQDIWQYKDGGKTEGIAENGQFYYDYIRKEYCRTCSVSGLQSLWDTIYKKQGLGFDENPWIWLIEFEVIKSGMDK